MKIRRICLLFLLVVVGSALAFGNSVTDPKIIIHGVSGSAPTPMSCPQGCTNVGLNFSFSVPEGGKGTLFFTNTSGQNWTSLALIEKGVAASAISCNGSSLFLSCTTKTLAHGFVEILLSGVKGSHNPQKGILNGQSFAITFGKGWPAGLEFTAHANVSAVPEPGTIALMATGLAVLVSRRKSWKNRWNR